jgi:hypothetical protein
MVLFPKLASNLSLPRRSRGIHKRLPSHIQVGALAMQNGVVLYEKLSNI